MLVFIGFSCCEDPGGSMFEDVDLTDIVYDPVNYEPEIPFGFPALEVPEDNPLTLDGIDLGRHLFYDPVLSLDSTMSCSSCHLPELHFQDNQATSLGVDGINGNRSSMSLVNVGFSYNGLFWDGRVQTLEAQALLPVEDEVELHNTWPNVIDKLKQNPFYQEKFRKAFGIENTSEITKELAAKAIASFERIIITGHKAKYNRVQAGLGFFSPEEAKGLDLFEDTSNIESDSLDAECSHCHVAPLFTTNFYENNGLDSVGDNLSLFLDKGRGAFLNDPAQNGKFKVPTLYNVGFTAPYMHDGRMEDLEEVLHHYNSGGKNSINKNANIRPLELNEEKIQALITFMNTLVDTSYLENEMLQNPF